MTAPVHGLDSNEVAERVADGRTNAFVEPSSRSLWSIARSNIFTLFNGIVVACFAVLFALGRWQDALFGFSAVANAFIGSGQEYRAKRALDRLALLNAPRARVVRGGELVTLATDDVVLDDVLVLRAGDQVTADAIVVAGDDLQLDESMLTGESDAVAKSIGDEVLSGSVVVAGEGYARASRVGADSFANRFAAEAKRFSLVTSELRSGIDRVLKWVSIAIGPVALVVLNSQIIAAGGWETAFESGSWRDAAVAAIAAIVAMIPLGLVLMTSITFAVAAVKLSRQQVLVQELAAVEVLARVDIVCLDKTGTLTEGDIVFDEAHPVEGAARGWERVLGWYAVQDDANATARGLGVRFTASDVLVPTGRVAFSSARKWSSVSFGADEVAGTWVLGGPEMVFAGRTDADAVELMARGAELARTGRRTLVLAHAAAGTDGTLTADDVLAAQPTAAVLLTFRESVRPDAHDTLRYFAEQGVEVRVISGDNPQTVAAIAREVGVDAPSGFDARELPDDDAEFAKVLAEHRVFGRVTPEQKKRIVLSLQASGHTVAMTGDGVNDALAIKEADIGIAMESGAQATKAVARIILLDGRFAHMPGVVAEGRQVIGNIERVSMLFLSKTTWATGLALVFGVLLLPFPFLPRQLSIVDGLTIGIPAFFLALLPNTARYMPGFLRRSLSFAVPSGVVITAAIALYSVASSALGTGIDEVRTGAVIILTIIGFWILVVLSRPITAVKAVVIGAMMIAFVLILAVPIAREFLQLVDVGLPTALLVIAGSLAGIGGVEVVRFVHRRLLRRWASESSGSGVRRVRSR